MRPVVSDCGPLHYLVLIEAVELLPEQFGRVLIPEAVAIELSHRPRRLLFDHGWRLRRLGSTEGPIPARLTSPCRLAAQAREQRSSWHNPPTRGYS